MKSDLSYMYDMIAEKHGIDNINQVEADGDLQKSIGPVLMVFRSFQIRETPLAGSEIQRVSREREVYLYMILRTDIRACRVPVL